MSDQDTTRAERQARYYESAKSAGKLRKPIKVDPALKDRFDRWRNEKNFTVDQAFEHLLKSQGI